MSLENIVNGLFKKTQVNVVITKISLLASGERLAFFLMVIFDGVRIQDRIKVTKSIRSFPPNVLSQKSVLGGLIKSMTY